MNTATHFVVALRVDGLSAPAHAGLLVEAPEGEAATAAESKHRSNVCEVAKCDARK